MSAHAVVGGRSLRRVVVTAVVVALLAVFMIPAPAEAKLYPSGCQADGKGNNGYWTRYCWLGQDGSKYDNKGDYVVGVQRILRNLPVRSPGWHDGYFGRSAASVARGDRCDG